MELYMVFQREHLGFIFPTEEDKYTSHQVYLILPHPLGVLVSPQVNGLIDSPSAQHSIKSPPHRRVRRPSFKAAIKEKHTKSQNIQPRYARARKSTAGVARISRVDG
jgi:hypothetical protein